MTRVLFADGEPQIRRLWVEELRDEGYEVLAAGGGGETVRLLDLFQPDVVILEIFLPDMSGLEAGRMVKGTRKSTRVILYSHFRPPRDFAPYAADDYVRKSPDPDTLKAAVRRQLLH